MQRLPVGTVTFLLTDVEGSTQLWQAAPNAMTQAIRRHYEILDAAVASNGGVRPQEQGEGDSIVAAFSRASDAFGAALTAQRMLRAEPWPTPTPLRVRMAIHSGEAQLRDPANYIGMTIIRTARLRALASGGQVLVSSASRILALDQLDGTVSLRDLGLHRLKDLTRPERVYEVTQGDFAEDFPLLRSLDSTPNNLPVRLSSFVGRRQELATLDSLFSRHRLVTIAGPGGAGKTRLALQAAANSTDHFSDGVWWIELAPLGDASGVAGAVAAAIDARLTESEDHAETIATRLGSDHALLIFDNCEQVVDASARLVDVLLQRCPNLKILTTTRVVLGVPGEETWRIPPLELPVASGPVSIDALRRSDSVRLFADRAGEARPGFSLTDFNAPTVAEICHRLDGIPLAIELAAARAKTLLPTEILEGLTDALRLLTGGSRLAHPRQQTLDASVRWSCDLLGDYERVLLYGLSVFGGSFDLQAAQEVCGDDEHDAIVVLDALGRLVDSSLVVALDETQQSRFLLLEAVRQYGHHELLLSDLLDTYTTRHAQCFERRVLSVAPRCEGRDQFAAVHHIEADYSNIRIALHWLAEQQAAHRLAPCVLALGAYWDVSGARVDSTMWCNTALGLVDGAPSAVRARLLALRAESRLQVTEFRAGIDDANQAYAMGNAVGDTWAAGRGSAALTSALSLIDLNAWRVRWAETARLHRAAGDSFSLGRLLTWAGVPLIRRGMTKEGRAALRVAAPYLKDLGQPMLIAAQQAWEAQVAVNCGELAEAESLAATALASGALIAESRVAVATHAASLARAFRFASDRDSSAVHLGRADAAKRRIDPFCEELHLQLAMMELLHEDPESCARLVDDMDALHPRRAAFGRCGAAVIGGYASFALGNIGDAACRAAQALTWAQEGCHLLEEGRALVLRGAAALAAGDAQIAEESARDAIGIHRTNGNTLMLCDAFELLAAVTATCGDAAEAAIILGSMQTRRSEMQAPRGFSIDSAASAVTLARSGLGDEAFERSFAAGNALDLDALGEFVERTDERTHERTRGNADLSSEDGAVK